jgi:hypothetical protein
MNVHSESFLELFKKTDNMPKHDLIIIDVSIKNAIKIQEYVYELTGILSKPFEIGETFKFRGYICKVVNDNL